MAEKPHIGVIIATPSRGMVRIEWAAMLASLAMPVNFNHMLRMIPGRTVEESRNIACAEALEHEADFLFFLDDDVLCPTQTVRRMIFAMKQNPDWSVLSGIVTTKADPPEPCVFRGDEGGPYWGWTFNKTFEISSCGMACCMIRTSILRDLEQPWFAWEQEVGPDSRGITGEDLYFCRSVKAAGGRIFGDGGICCGHMDETGKVWMIDNTTGPFKRAGVEELAKYVVMEPEAA